MCCDIYHRSFNLNKVKLNITDSWSFWSHQPYSWVANSHRWPEVTALDSMASGHLTLPRLPETCSSWKHMGYDQWWNRVWRYLEKRECIVAHIVMICFVLKEKSSPSIKVRTQEPNQRYIPLFGGVVHTPSMACRPDKSPLKKVRVPMGTFLSVLD